MAQGSKAKYTTKQKRKARHIEGFRGNAGILVHGQFATFASLTRHENHFFPVAQLNVRD